MSDAWILMLSIVCLAYCCCALSLAGEADRSAWYVTFVGMASIVGIILFATIDLDRDWETNNR